MRVLLTYPPTEFIQRQSPGGLGVWGDAHFETRPTGGTWDGWVVFERLAFPQSNFCDPGRTVFVAAEPESVRKYDPRFLSQFGAVIAARRDLDHPHVIPGPPMIPWWVGITAPHELDKTASRSVLDYDTLKAMPPFTKPKLASIICSSKMMTDGHRVRLALLDKIRARFTGRIDFFGKGFTPIHDKWDAIAPYRHCIVLENSCDPDYWTEKLSDTFLGGAFPIYSGCPNLGDYFPADAFELIDRNDPDAAVAIIDRVLTEDVFAQRSTAINEARRRVLDQYNLYPMLKHVLERLPVSSPRPIQLRPEHDFTDPAARRCKRTIKRLVFGTGPRSG